jgi:hypothetical protein
MVRASDLETPKPDHEGLLDPGTSPAAEANQTAGQAKAAQETVDIAQAQAQKDAEVRQANPNDAVIRQANSSIGGESFDYGQPRKK